MAVIPFSEQQIPGLTEVEVQRVLECCHQLQEQGRVSNAELNTTEADGSSVVIGGEKNQKVLIACKNDGVYVLMEIDAKGDREAVERCRSGRFADLIEALQHL